LRAVRWRRRRPWLRACSRICQQQRPSRGFRPQVAWMPKTTCSTP
jgi:hypothetical protein